MARCSRCRPLCFGLRACACSAVACARTRGSSPTYTIAFKSFAPNNTDIFIQDADASPAHPLAPDAAMDYNAAFSSYGRWVVFPSHRSGSGNIYRVLPDGSGLERLTDDSVFNEQGVL